MLILNKNFIQDISLIDLGYVGPAFTWYNGVGNNDPIFARLDHALCNSDWLLKFKDNGVLHLPRISNGHSPILINTHRKNKRKRKHSNKFEFFWVDHPEFRDVVINAWADEHTDMVSKLKDGERILISGVKTHLGIYFKLSRRQKKNC